VQDNDINMIDIRLVLQVLAKTLSTLHEDKVVDKDEAFLPVKCFVINPKSVSQGELYGAYREMSEWRDGILSKITRDCVADFNSGCKCRKWIILDGPVDALWIEVDLGPLDSLFSIPDYPRILHSIPLYPWNPQSSFLIRYHVLFLFLFLFSVSPISQL
jgi:hypothetical protein